MSDTVPQPIQPPTEFAPDWSRRRSVIYVSLWVCGGLSSLIVVTACMMLAASGFVSITTDAGLMNLLGSALYTIAFVATSIIGSYVFGVNFDSANFRQHVKDWVAASAAPTDQGRR